MKTAAQVVVNSPVGHFRKSMGDPIEEGLIFRVLIVAEEKLVNTCIRKFRCSTQSTVLGIVGARDLFGGFSNDVWREITLALAGLRHSFQRGENLSHALLDVLGPFTIGLSDADEDPLKPGHSLPVLRRKIGTPVKRFALRREKDRHGPAAPAGEHLHGIHVNLIKVGALFAIHFDADEKFIHQSGDLFVFERFTLHDMAPVTGRIPDAKKDGSIFAPGFLEGFVTPWVPIHRIVSVLEQIWARLVDEAVCMLRVHHLVSSIERIHQFHANTFAV